MLNGKPESGATSSAQPARSASAPHATRRTIALGAAWAGPAVLATTTAPASATSAACPTVPSVRAWTTKFSGAAGGKDTSRWYADPPVAFKHVKDATRNGPLYVTTSATVTDLVPGRAYDVNLLIAAGFGAAGANRAPAGSTGAHVSVTLGGVTLFKGGTRSWFNGYTYLNTSTAQTLPYQTYRAKAYTATATSATLTYAFESSPLTEDRICTDDIFVQMPQFLC